MASDFLQNEDNPRAYWASITRIAKVLLLLSALVILDGFNRQWSILRSYDQFQIALYDFTVKYRQPLEKWYRDSVKSASSQDVVVRFERRYSVEPYRWVPATPDYFALDEVPLLDGYLKERFPMLTSQNRRFLGYEMSFEAYCILVNVVPTTLLIGLAWNFARLRRSWIPQASASSRLLDDLPFFRSTSRRKIVGTLKAATTIPVLLVVALSAPLMMPAHQILVQPGIQGELFLDPLKLPSLDLSILVLPPRAITESMHEFGWALLVDLMACAFIMRTMLRQKAPRKTSVEIAGAPGSRPSFGR